jgi:hypothetical protein
MFWLRSQTRLSSDKIQGWLKKDPNLESDIRAGRIAEGMTFNQKVWALTSRISKGV